MDRDGTFIVETISWDLTMGAASNFFGQLLLRGTSSSSQSIPEAIDHVGIIVYNRLYEYGHNGIVKSSLPRCGDDPLPQYPGCKLRKREFIGRTAKTREVFVEWIVNAKYGEFKGSNYDMIHHNCLHFAKAVCIFLEVPPSPNWDKVCNWAKTNNKLADMLTRGFRNPLPRPTPRLRETGRSSSLQESASSGDNRNQMAPSSPTIQRLCQPTSSPRRRRFSVCSIINRSDRVSIRSASMETLPPTYEEAVRMNCSNGNGITDRRDSAPKYEDLMRDIAE